MCLAYTPILQSCGLWRTQWCLDIKHLTHYLQQDFKGAFNFNPHEQDFKGASNI